jgi:hypothetical protein
MKFKNHFIWKENDDKEAQIRFNNDGYQELGYSHKQKGVVSI